MRHVRASWTTSSRSPGGSLRTHCPRRLGFQDRQTGLYLLRHWSRRNAFFYCVRVRLLWSQVREWTEGTDPKQLVLLDVGYVVDNIDPPWKGEKCVVFLAIQAMARMAIWETRKKRLYDGANLCLRDLIFFKHQLRVKIRSDRKRLARITFDRRWVHAASLVVRKGAMLVSSFPSFPALGRGKPRLSKPYPS